MTSPAPGTAPEPTGTVVLFNPLPHALHHYEQAMVSALAPHRHVVLRRADFEIGSHGLLRRVAAALLGTLRLVGSATSRHPVVALWPAYGLLELALWRLLARAPRHVIVHDPTPLRRQVGYSTRGQRLARWGSRGRHVHVVAHTDLAARVLREAGVQVEDVVPHPLLTSREPRQALPSSRVRVLVAGQHKDARDTDVLARIAEAAPPEWQLGIAGRNWPVVTGWTIDSRFLPEAEFDARLRGADVLLLPYDYYFQSGVAARAIEVGVPVAARRHEFLESLYGVDWPGFVDDESPAAWVAAIDRARHTEPPQADELEQRIADAWDAQVSKGGA